MARAVVVGPRESPVAEVASFLRERGVPAIHVHVECGPRPEARSSGGGRWNPLGDRSDAATLTGTGARQVERGTTDLGAGEADIVEASSLNLGGVDDPLVSVSASASRFPVTVWWESAVALLSSGTSGFGSGVVVVVGFSKREVVSACARGEADYAVIWPKEKDVLAAVVKAEMSVAETTGQWEDRPTCVGVTSVKSSGATLLVASLASQLTSMGRRVCLMDLDYRYRELTELIAEDSALASPGSALGSLVRVAVPGSIAHRLYTACSATEKIWSSGIKTLIESEPCELLVVDAPGREIESLIGHRSDGELRAFDIFLVILPLDYFGVRQARMFFEAIDEALTEKPGVPVFCSLRRSGPRPEEIASLFGDRPYFELPWVPEEAGDAIDEGRVLAPSDRSPYGRAVSEMVQWILEQPPRRAVPASGSKDVSDPKAEAWLEWSA